MSLFDSKDNNPESVTIDAYSVVTTDASSDSDVTNTEAINIETVAGLGQFLKAAEQVYDDASLFEEDAKADDYQKLKTAEIEGDKVYDSLQDKFSELKGLVDKCRYEVLPKEEEISDYDFERLQVIYNEIISLRNLLIEAYSINLDEVEDGVGVKEIIDTPVEVVETIEQVVPKTKFKPYEKAEKVEVKVPVSIALESNDIKTKVVETKEPELAAKNDEYTGIVKYLAEVVTQAKDLLQFINNTKSELDSLLSPSYRTAEIVTDLSELSVSLKRAEKLVSRLESIDVSREDESVLKTALEKYQQIFIEIIKNVEAINTVLLKKYNETKTLEQKIEERDEVVLDKVSVPVLINTEKKVVEAESEMIPVETKKPVYIETICDDKKTESGLPLSKRRCEMFIIPDTGGDGQVQITVAEKAEDLVQKSAKNTAGLFSKINLFGQVRGNFVPKNISGTEASVVAKTEMSDPINRVIPSRVPNFPVVESADYNDSLTRKYLSDEPYQTFIKDNFHSPDNFDRVLNTTIAQIEAKSTDAIERWLNEMRASTFGYLKDMKISDIEDLSSLSYDEVNSVLNTENVKYNSFVVWLDMLDEMKSDLSPVSTMEFGELFTKWMVILEMDNYDVASG